MLGRILRAVNAEFNIGVATIRIDEIRHTWYSKIGSFIGFLENLQFMTNHIIHEKEDSYAAASTLGSFF